MGGLFNMTAFKNVNGRQNHNFHIISSIITTEFLMKLRRSTQTYEYKCVNMC